eukprot:TRINITY_DN11441_c0_g2_i11.p1 TRINITY_DN11441_c0_g2~~TRINITY_DN11441_c0_g2_i11.p1  ORF type:complete len:344 (+),score=99.84 TRINITY_DN11441_c0_g2_i11:65-1096(+)
MFFYKLFSYTYLCYFFFFFFFKQKTAYEMLRSLVGSEMCIRDRYQRRVRGGPRLGMGCGKSSEKKRHVHVDLQAEGVGKLVKLRLTRPLECEMEAADTDSVGSLLARVAVLIGLEPEQGECLGMVHNEMVVEDHDATLAKAGISGDFLVKGTRAARADAVDKAKSVNLFTKYLVHASGAHGIKCLELVCKYAPERFRERHGKRDFTPLHYAAKRNSPEIGKMLLDHGAELEARSRDFATPLHVAAEYNSTEMAMMLINAGARVNPKDTPRPTPLWWATRNHLTKNHHHDDDEARAKQHPLEQQHDHPQGHVDMVRILEDAGGTGLFLLGESNSAEDSAHVRIM